MNIIKMITKNTATRLALLALALSASAFAFGGSADAEEGVPGPPPTQTEETGKNKKDHKPCRDALRHVKHQGESCRVDGGLWKVKLADGSTVLTHGPDASPLANGASGKISPQATPRRPVCSTTNYFRAIIARPFDAVGDKTVASLRANIDAVNGIFFHAAVESGSPNGANLPFLCDSTGQVRVDVVTLNTASAQASFATIESELRAKGYNKTYEKYAVYYEAALGSSCGQGSIETDATDSSSNLNNVGPSYALVFNCNDLETRGTLLHEIGHNLGAVQLTAPHGTGRNATNGWHCWESFDVMCYNDQGNRDPGYIVNNCPDFDHFDCNHDDYFDARIGVGQGGLAGSYIDKNWNIGDCYVKFVVNNVCSADTTPPTVTAPLQSLIEGATLNSATGVPANGIPTRISWSASDSSGIASFEVWDYTSGFWAKQTLTSPTATSLAVNLAPGSTHYFAVKARDGAGNPSGWFYTPNFTAGLQQESAGTVTGSWFSQARAGSSGGSVYYSTAANSSFTVGFSGRNVAWVAPVGADRGRAHVYIDGAFSKTVDLYSSAVSERRVVFSKALTSAGAHTLKIVVEGTSGRPYVTVDAFEVLQ